MVAIDQIKLVDPSVPPALFRLLLRDESVAYLREGDGIFGFEVSPKSDDISGFALIAIKKHTLLAYKSDLGQKPKLILFPSMEKLFDESFGLLDLTCAKKFYTSDEFKGRVVETGPVRELVRDLLPPIKEVPDISDDLSSEIARVMATQYNDIEAQDVLSYKPTFQDKREAKSVAMNQRPTIVQPVVTEKIEVQKHPTDALRDEKFSSIEQVISFCVMNYGADRAILDKLHKAIMQKAADLGDGLVDGYVTLVVKCFEKDKIKWNK